MLFITFSYDLDLSVTQWRSDMLNCWNFEQKQAREFCSKPSCFSLQNVNNNNVVYFVLRRWIICYIYLMHVHFFGDMGHTSFHINLSFFVSGVSIFVYIWSFEACLALVNKIPKYFNNLSQTATQVHWMINWLICVQYATFRSVDNLWYFVAITEFLLMEKAGKNHKLLVARKTNN